MYTCIDSLQRGSIPHQLLQLRTRPVVVFNTHYHVLSDLIALIRNTTSKRSTTMSGDPDNAEMISSNKSSRFMDLPGGKQDSSLYQWISH
jgi:hypothetical protein